MEVSGHHRDVCPTKLLVFTPQRDHTEIGRYNRDIPQAPTPERTLSSADNALWTQTNVLFKMLSAI